MQPEVYPLNSIAQDSPIALLNRRKVEGEKMLIAHIELEAGCHVAPHRHPSEQMSYLVSGRVMWRFAEPGAAERNVEATAGSIVHLPANSWHGVDALENAIIVDVLSPPAAMGVDSQ